MTVWARVIASVLAPGGELYFADAKSACNTVSLERRRATSSATPEKSSPVATAPRRTRQSVSRPGKLRFLIGVKNPLPIRPAATA
jgi:hypothetical protein